MGWWFFSNCNYITTSHPPGAVRFDAYLTYGVEGKALRLRY